MLEKRVEKLEESMRSIEASLVEIKTTLKYVATSSDISRLEARIPEIVIAEIKERSNHVATAADVARIDGRVSQIPTIWQLIGVLIGIAMLVFAANNYLGQTQRQLTTIEKPAPSKP